MSKTITKNQILVTICNEDGFESLEESKIIIKIAEKEFFTITNLNSNDVLVDFGTNEDKKQIIQRSGILNFEFTFKPNRSFGETCKDLDKDLDKTITYEQLRSWFEKLLPNGKAYSFYLIPDSNIFLDGYYSNYLKEVISEILQKHRHSLYIVIPRIANLELERQANTDDDSKLLRMDEIVKKVDLIADRTLAILTEFSELNSDPVVAKKISRMIGEAIKLRRDNETQNKELKRKRRSFLALNEAYLMIADGAYVMGTLEYPVNSFLSNSGGGFADALMRIEIAKYIGDGNAAQC